MKTIETMNPTRTYRVLLSLLFTAFAFMFLSVAFAPSAHANCGGVAICGGTGTSPGTGTPPGAPTGSPAQQIGEARGGALAPTRPAPPQAPPPPMGLNEARLYQTWTQLGSVGRCPVRNDGKGAIQAIDTYGKYMLENVSGVNPGGWTSAGRAPNGTYFWERTALLSTACKYPPRVYYTTVMCSISQTVQANMVAPANKVLATRTTNTGYAENSGSLNSCYGAYGNVYLNQPITEYGFYNIYTWQRMQAVQVEVAYTANEVTGVMPAPRIVSRSAAYNTLPYLAQTASLDCQNGFRTPGINRSDWTETPCQNIANPSYICVRNPINFDVGDGATKTMLPSASGFMQLMRDGKSRAVVFNQRPQGASISVNAGRYQTTFFRSADSTPWNDGAMWNNNLYKLSLTEKGTNALSQDNGKKSNTMPGRVNNTWMTAIQASDNGKSTKITQRLNWAGTRTIQSGTITMINANTGAVSWAPRTVNVPTSGICDQTATVEYIRAVGDAVR